MASFWGCSGVLLDGFTGDPSLVECARTLESHPNPPSQPITLSYSSAICVKRPGVMTKVWSRLGNGGTHGMQHEVKVKD